MTDEEALLRAVCEEPDDDGPRLVYADWLEEHGNAARAEFIRLQCELAKLPPDPPASDNYTILVPNTSMANWSGLPSAIAHRPRLKRRQDELLQAHEAEWLAPLRPWKRSPQIWHSFNFVRGFVDYLNVRIKPFIESTTELFAKTPLQRVFLGNPATSDCARLAEQPLLLRLRELSLRSVVDGQDRGLERLLASPHLANLRQLRLSFSRDALSSAAVEVLANAGTLAGLTDLDLSNNSLDDSAAAALAASPYLGRLERLNLTWNTIGPEGQALLQARFGDRVILTPMTGDEIPF
jgi:uncharacterized protein (TIGR02996 family)